MNHQPSTINKKNGFTLLEMSIVLLIISSMIGGGLMFFNEYRDRNRLIETEQKMATILEKIRQYTKTFNQLPCPGDITLAPTNPDYGIENEDSPVPNRTRCGIDDDPIYIMGNGMVPFIALGLSEEYAYDGWGNRFRYLAAAADTKKNAGGDNTTRGVVRNYNGAVGGVSSVILMSHGENGIGAVGRRGQVDSTNIAQYLNIQTYWDGSDAGADPVDSSAIAKEAANAFNASIGAASSFRYYVSGPINGFDDIFMMISSNEIDPLVNYQ